MSITMPDEINGASLSVEEAQNFGREFFVAYVTGLEHAVDAGGVDQDFGLKWYTPDMPFLNTNGAVYRGEQMAAWGADLFAPFCLVSHSVDSVMAFPRPGGFIEVHAYGKRILRLKENKAQLEPDFAIPYAVRNLLGPASEGRTGFKGHQWHDFCLYWDTAPLKAALGGDATVFRQTNS